MGSRGIRIHGCVQFVVNVQIKRLATHAQDGYFYLDLHISVPDNNHTTQENTVGV